MQGYNYEGDDLFWTVRNQWHECQYYISKFKRQIPLPCVSFFIGLKWLDCFLLQVTGDNVCSLALVDFNNDNQDEVGPSNVVDKTCADLCDLSYIHAILVVFCFFFLADCWIRRF